MSLPNPISPRARAPAFLNINEPVSNVNSALVMSHNGTFALPREQNQHHGQEITSIIEQNVHFGPTVSQQNGQVNPNVENSSRTKRRRERKSKVWDDFTAYEGEDGKEWALCKHCKKKFVGSTKSGTTHLKNHLERCPKKRDPGGSSDHKSIEASDSLKTLVVSKEKSKLNQELNHLDETRMIIKYWRSSLESIKDDILEVYLEERKKLCKYLTAIPSRFNVTIEWRHKACVPFMVLHFIDDNWELKKRIIQFLPHPKDLEFEILRSSILDWKIERRILCIVDFSLLDMDYRELIEFDNWFIEQVSLRSIGINGLSVDWLVENLRSEQLKLDMIREHVSDLLIHVRCFLFPARDFQIAIAIAKSMDKKLPSQAIEPPNDMSTGFELLEWAIRFEEVFCIMVQERFPFIEPKLIQDSWHKGTMVYECITALNDAGRSLSETESKYTTANVYFPMICDIFLKLLQWEKSEYEYIRDIASHVRDEFFDEFWANSKWALVITAVLDPRFKMDIVQRWYKLIYAADADRQLKMTSDYFTEIYNDYAKGPNNSRPSSSNHGDGNSSTAYKMLDDMGRPCTSSQHVNDIASPQSELDRYLQDRRVPAVEEFDILAWWRSNSSTYPTVARIARDFLSIPIYVRTTLDSSLSAKLEDIFSSKDLDDSLKQALAYVSIWCAA